MIIFSLFLEIENLRFLKLFQIHGPTRRPHLDAAHSAQGLPRGNQRGFLNFIGICLKENAQVKVGENRRKQIREELAVNASSVFLYLVRVEILKMKL